MAFSGIGAGDLSSDRLSSEFLHCPLCFDRFAVPKVLPCQHTFCLDCLRRYVGARGLDNIVPCPMCKELTVIPGNDVANFKSNFMIVSLLCFVDNAKVVVEEPSTSESPASPTSLDSKECGACGEESDLPNFCQSCQLWICERCTRAHIRVPSTSNHNLLSNEEVVRQCKEMVPSGESALQKLHQDTTDKEDALCVQIEQLPENISMIKRKIGAAAEEAHNIITEKHNELLSKADEFLFDQGENLSQRLQDIGDKRKSLDDLLELLHEVTISDDGHKNQKAIKSIEKYISNRSLSEGNVCTENIDANLTFSPFTNNLTELKNMDLGCLRTVHMKSSTHLLYDRPLRVHKISSLTEQDYISGLVINKFADKIVVANNNYISMFKPDSSTPKPFLSPLSERKIQRPWSIAYCEEERRIFITEAGMYEGEGAVISYSLDGKFHSVIASGLTLPRGIAVHKKFVFVCDQIDKCVFVFNSWGKVTKVLKKTPDGKCLFNGPMFVSVGKSGRMAVSDSCMSIKIFDKDCNLLFTYNSNFSDSEFWDVLVLQDNTVITCDWKHGLHKISSDFTVNGLVCTESNLPREPSALAALENGNCIYVGTFGGEIFSVI